MNIPIMEIRWKRGAVVLLLLIVTSITANDASSEERHQQELEKSFVVPAHASRSAPSVVESGTQPADSGHFRLADELIGVRAASKKAAQRQASATATDNARHVAKKRPLGKESKKYRKKYVSESDYRKSMPQDIEQRATAEEKQEGEEPMEHADGATKSNEPHSRQKRLIWVTDDGRLALPPGTSLTIAPTIALPFVRYPPDGFLSNISISLPITIDFDKLGLTDNQNPLGVLPPLFARSMGQAAGSVLADYVSDYMRIQRLKRSAPDASNDHFKITTNKLEDDGQTIPQLPVEHKHAFHGGERALLYIVVEDFLATFGLDGRACMLRAICEVHSKSLNKFGLIGEMLKLFFTASLSPYSQHLEEYVTAEKIGRGQDGPGECFPYYKDCPKSLFRTSNAFQHRYQPQSKRQDDTEQEVDEDHFGNEIPNGSDESEYLVREPRASRSRSTNTKESTVVQIEQRDLTEMAM